MNKINLKEQMNAKMKVQLNKLLNKRAHYCMDEQMNK